MKASSTRESAPKGNFSENGLLKIDIKNLIATIPSESYHFYLIRAKLNVTGTSSYNVLLKYLACKPFLDYLASLTSTILGMDITYV